VLEEGRIDPEAEKLKAIERRHEERLRSQETQLVGAVAKTLDKYELR
jgi:hypothetical protein